MQHKDYAPQRTNSLVISSQEPTGHKCGNSFFNNKAPIHVQYPIPIKSFPLEVGQKIT